MDQVWIFGDSFTTDFYSTFEGKLFRDNTWPYMLKKNYNVYNPSLCGAGPLTMINLFLYQGKKAVPFYDWENNHHLLIKNEFETDTKNTTVLFFISNINRVHFNFLQVIQHENMYNNIENTEYKEYKNNMDFLYNHYFTDKWCQDNLCFILFTLFYLSEIFKKILIFPIFQQEYEMQNSDFLKFRPKPKNCHIVDRSLYLMTENHKGKLPKYNSEGNLIDNNPNHILQEKHIHIYNFLNKYIIDSTLDYHELDKIIIKD